MRVRHTALLFSRNIHPKTTTGMSSVSSLNYFEYVLSLFNKSLKKIVILIGDNWNVNKAIARLSYKTLLGCASHKFNLAVEKNVLAMHEPNLHAVNQIMIGLSCLVLAAKRRQLTHRKSKKRNETRWSSSLKMLPRYKVLHTFSDQMHVEDMDGMWLTPRQNREVDELLAPLEDIYWVEQLLET